LGWRRGSVRFIALELMTVIAELSFDCRYQRSTSVRFLLSFRPLVNANERTRHVLIACSASAISRSRRTSKQASAEDADGPGGDLVDLIALRSDLSFDCLLGLLHCQYDNGVTMPTYSFQSLFW
jgi:hypothetical protein